MMSDDVVFGDEDTKEEQDLQTQSDRIEELEERINQLENQVLPSIRKVETENGTRYIVEQGVERWYKPETLQAKLEGNE